VAHLLLELPQIVPARMQLQPSQQLPLGLAVFAFRRRPGQFHAQPLGGGAERVPQPLDVFGLNETAPLQSPDRRLGLKQLSGDGRGGQRPELQHAQQLHGRTLIGARSAQLPQRVPARLGEGVNLAPAQLAAQRDHHSQDLPQRGAIIAGDPAGQLQQRFFQRRRFLQQPQRLAGGLLGSLVVAAQHESHQLARAERHQQPATRAYAAPQGFRQGVGEGLVQRDRQADVAIGRCRDFRRRAVL